MEKRKKPLFLRTDWNRKPRFRISSRWKWRRAKGRHSKIRRKRKGHMNIPGIGYGMPREIKGLINGMKPILVQNLLDLGKIGKNEIGVVSSKIGMRKKVEIAEKAIMNKVAFLNLNAEKFLSETKKKLEERKNSKKSSKEKESVEKK